MRVALVTVGDELLAGDTVNTNAAWLARHLVERGACVERVTVLPDAVGAIAQVVNEYHAAYDAVIVTGGIGPTHDDLTMEGVAAAFGRDLVESEAALADIEERGGYAREDLAAGTAQIPDSAAFVPNPEGVAPGAHIGDVYVIAGVPEEMKAMFGEIADDFDGEVDHVDIVRVDEPESALLSRIEELRSAFPVTVGSYPGEYVRLKISGPDADAVEAAARWLRERVRLAEE